MAAKYKFKPRKAVKKRFKVTATGKLKHQRTLRRHLLSGRSGDKKRELARPDVLSETHAKTLRTAMGVGGLYPKRTAKQRLLRQGQVVRRGVIRLGFLHKLPAFLRRHGHATPGL